VSGARRLIIPLLAIVIVLVFASVLLRSRTNSGVAHSYQGNNNSFVSQLNSGDISAVLVNTTAQTVQVAPKAGPTYTVGYPNSTQLTQLLAKQPTVAVTAKIGGSSWTSLLTLFLPVLLIIGVMIFMMRRMQGGAGGSKMMSFG
jgi:cell division protease FtsH